LESRNKNKNNKEKKAKHGYTKYRQNMIYRWAYRRCTSPQA
jgi:hypothetical protein